MLYNVNSGVIALKKKKNWFEFETEIKTPQNQLSIGKQNNNKNETNKTNNFMKILPHWKFKWKVELMTTFCQGISSIRYFWEREKYILLIKTYFALLLK